MRDPLTKEERSRLVADRPEWEVGDDVMTRTYVFADFGEAIGFVVRVALAAEVLDHHPDIEIRYDKVTLGLSTHSVGTLTALDVDLSARADDLAG